MDSQIWGKKHRCCETHLRPLLERIEQLEGKILNEVERREKEYNELLHMLLTVKRQKTNDAGVPFHETITDTITKTPSKVTVPDKMILNILGNSKFKGRRSSANAKLRVTDIHQKVKPATVVGQTQKTNLDLVIQTLQKRIVGTESTQRRFDEDLSKGKQLNEYLMGQLLIIYEKINQLQGDKTYKQREIATEETITSIIVDSHVQSQLKLAREQTIEAKMQKIEEMMKQKQVQMEGATAQLADHEAVISELIGLTHTLSNKIVEIPLFLSSSSELPMHSNGSQQ